MTLKFALSLLINIIADLRDYDTEQCLVGIVSSFEHCTTKFEVGNILLPFKVGQLDSDLFSCIYNFRRKKFKKLLRILKVMTVYWYNNL